MKKIIILTSLILFLLIGTGTCSQEPPPPTTQGQMQPGKLNSEASASSDIETNDNNNTSQNPISKINKIDTHSSNAKTQDAYKENSNSQIGAVKDDPITTYTFWLMIFTGALVICNIFLWLYTKKVANATKESADAAKRSAESLPRIERAYVFAEIKHLEYLKDGNSISVSASILMKNYGRTPATLNSVCGVITLKDARINEAMLIDIPPGFILGVGIDETNPCPFNVYIHLRDEEWQNVEREGITAYCCGKIFYNDIFHVSHETGFCWEFKPRTPPQWFISSKYKDLNYYK